MWKLKRFKRFYENLYKSEVSVDEDKYQEFVSKTDLPVVSPAQVEMLDAPVDEFEFREAILSRLV